MTINKPKIAIIVPRYGLESLGGAESLARGFAEEAANRGWKIEVLTTCSLSPYEWENVLPPGTEELNGVIVRRFPVHWTDPLNRRKLEDRLRIQHTLPVEEQYDWLKLGPQNFPMYNYILGNADNYHLFISLPYLDSVAYQAAWLLPKKTVLWPCLRDEVFAYLEPFRLLSESVLGIFFNSPEEADLALSILKWQPKHHATLGLGVDLSPGKDKDEPKIGRNLLYVGRLEYAKNLGILYDYAERVKAENPDFQLDIIGKGPFKPPDSPVFRSRGFLSEEDKARFYRSSLAVCQPSLNESLSLVIMESWLAERPVLVSSGCPVTFGHACRSKGGLGFSTYNEFAGALLWLQENPDQAMKMGQNGRNYVINNYTWKKVFKRFSFHLNRWQNVGKVPGYSK